MIKSDKTEWNLKLLFDGDDDPRIEKERQEIRKKVKLFVGKWKNNDNYLKEPEVLLSALNEYKDLNFIGSGSDGAGSMGGYYFWLRTQIDQNNPGLKAKYTQAQDFLNEVNNELRFFLLNLAKVDASIQNKFVNYSKLKDYKHFLERLFLQSRYLLSEESEKILSLKSTPAHENWTKMVSGFISKEEREIDMGNGKKEMKHESEIVSLLNNKNKSIRDSAAAAFNDILKKHIEVGEAEINSILYNKKIDNELRKMNRPDLARHLSDDIDSEVVDVLVDSVTKRFDISKRFYALKAKLLGLKKLEYHERNVPHGETDKKYSYQEAINLVHDTFTNLDKEFAEILNNFVENGQIDVFPKKGKRGGAFCTDGLLNQPTFIMLNHTNELSDVLTIAHELGHGINAELMRKKQNALNYGMVLSTAEVASTFMEDFVFEKLLKNVDDQEKLSLLMSRLGDDVNTIIRQIGCYKFEQDLHNEFKDKGYLSKEEIGKLFQKNMFNYMGESVEKSPGSENWWLYWSHIRTFFYVYSYSSGLLISKAMQGKVRKDCKFIEKVKEFLSAGTYESPKNLFLKLGIDITKKEFWNSGLDEVENLLNETEALAKKLGKI